jgi:ferric-dicitrate binding protein FerR (iron transport regulator)/tetratricopeptide (TPR) repeat protein
MTHDEAILLLSARLDGPLPPDQDQALDAWLAEAPDNRVLAEAFQTQHADLATTFEERREAARQTAAAVARQLPPPSPLPTPESGRWRRFFAPIPAAVAAAVLVGLGLLLTRRDKPDTISDEVASVVDSYEGFGLKPKPRPKPPELVSAKPGDTLVTQAGEKKRVGLPDGSTLYLNQKTELTVTGYRHLDLKAGEVFVEAYRPDVEFENRSPFVVATPKREVKALGTKFAVTANDAGTGVLVTQGEVAVSGLDKTLTTGQVLAAGGDEIAPGHRASAALDWTRDLMVAAESPLVPAGKYSGGSLVAVDPYGQEAKLRLVKYHIDVHIEDGFARTTIDQTYFNNENQRMEGTFYFPLPPDASLSRLAMYVEGNLMEGGMAEREQAANAYETIRYQNRDPALLEWVDGSVFKMRVFPLEARQEKRIVLSYTQRLPVLYGRTSYRFPAGHTLAMVDQWSFHGFVKNGADLSSTAPSHPDMRFTPQGRDLVLDDSARNVKVDRDVVVELTDHQAQGDQARWSLGELDGQRYLMLRFRPDLPTAPRRERRDWVVLFESSGARDPLVARAQVEVIRSLLTHAEHDDTFAVLTVGTRVRKWKPEPVAATAENVGEAVAWLEKAHLIGATNLDQALSDVEPLLRAGSNPHLVHVGGGIASIGEQRADELVKRIPQGTRYVGIGVGRKFSPAFMKVAAERTGGLFTQVNPDESMAWRGFEIASTLNAPRLLNVHVTTAEAGGPRFLTFANTLAHGEEFAAVANVTKGFPTSVTVHGVMDGQPFQRVVPVEVVKNGADYLPRTWAKLEIDRLMAAGSDANRKTITELSKAMYVMTPFTSLLVLENEQMYKDFKVDRGRKDHWAMYAAPAKIPVVYIPDPNLPAGSGVDLHGQKPHENQVLQTVLHRNAPQVLTWAGRNNGDNPIVTAGQRIATPDLDQPIRATSFGRSIPTGDYFDVAGVLGADMDVSNSDFGTTVYFATDGKALKELEALSWGKDRLVRAGSPDGRFGGRALGRTRLHRSKLSEDVTQLSVERLALNGLRPSPLAEDAPNLDVFFKISGGGSGAAGRGDRSRKFQSLRGQGLARHMYSELSGGDGGELADFEYAFRDVQLGAVVNRPVLAFRGTSVRHDEKIREELGKRLSNDLRGYKQTLADPTGETTVLFSRVGNVIIEGNRPAEAAWLDQPRDGYPGLIAPSNFGTAPPYYSRPSFNGQYRLLTDLVSHAPGMSSSPADVRAVLEAEAAPRFGNKRGTIDPAARALIDAARTTEWRTTSLGKDGKLKFTHDGQGRYAYERRLAFGLIERVVCDGPRLWHLYPELGIGAERIVTRHHREFLLDLVPDFVPPADDLAVGADVKRLDERTVALVPLFPASDEPTVAWVELHLVFEGNRLAERRWVLNGTAAMKKEDLGLIAREVYAADAVQVFDDKEKELAKSDRKVERAGAPDLAPDLRRLVVLPLPLRSREHTYHELGFDAGQDLYQNQNACFEYLTPEAQLKLLACEFASNNGQNVGRIFDACFRQKGDTRPGFFTLLSATNTSPRSWGLGVAFERNRTDPLLAYLYWTHDGEFSNWQARYGLAPARMNATDFLGRLDAFRTIAHRWGGGHINEGGFAQRDAERARVFEFVRANADNALGWAALGLVQDNCFHPTVWKQLADAWALVAQKSSLKYQARYEEARCLGNAGDLARSAQKADQDLFLARVSAVAAGRLAQIKYQGLFRDALKEGVLPPLDASFRSVLEKGEQGEWAKLMRETASICAKRKARPVIVTLAWQCYQLGDVAMADTLLDAALDGVPEKEKALTFLAAVHFLNATNRFDRADALVRELLADKTLAEMPGLWRLASQVADNRQDRVRAIECLETALNMEFDKLPEVFDVQPIRNDYGRLLSHYEWLADASKSLNVTPPKDLVERVVRAADRWRHLDPEAADVPNRVAALLRKTSGDDARSLAWDYATTPLAVKPNESGPWVSLAAAARQEGDWPLADKCYAMAFAAEPTNAQLLWDRASYLQQQGQVAESRKLYRQLASSEWQPRFAGLKAQAREAAK